MCLLNTWNFKTVLNAYEETDPIHGKKYAAGNFVDVSENYDESF